MRRSRVAWGIAGLDIVAFLVASMFDPAGDVGAAVLYAIGIASFAGVGALLCTRVPANPIGVLLLAAGTVLVAAIVIGTYADLGALQVPPWPGSGLARLVGDTLFIYPFVIALIGVPLVFPDGRLLSRRFRWMVWIAIANMVAWTLGGILGPSPGGASGDDPRPRRPRAVRAVRDARELRRCRGRGLASIPAGRSGAAPAGQVVRSGRRRRGRRPSGGARPLRP